MTAALLASAARPLVAYLAARYQVFTPHAAVTLRIGATTDPTFAATGPWAIVSAANPGSWPALRAANAARQAELLAIARTLDCPWHPARNAAEDGSWPEDAVALRVSAAQADAIARHFGQAASVFVPTDGPPRLRCLRLDWRPAIRTVSMDVHFIDWLP